jgi:hypothetical protein
MPTYKNIQVIDGADNCTFPIFQATEEEFSVIFPAPGQDIEFIEDLTKRLKGTQFDMSPLWDRPIRKDKALGIHGTLFCEFKDKRKHFPPSKRERDWNPLSINKAQRHLWDGEEQV